jgi:hypothetical protein
MSTLGKVLWVAAAAAFALWLLVALLMGWRWVWRRRESINKNMATVYRHYGEEYRPVGPLWWAWIVVRSIPMLFLFAAFGIFAFFLHIPAMIWSLATGRPIPAPHLSDLDNDAS